MRRNTTLGITAMLATKLLREPKLYLVIAMLVAILDEYTGGARHILLQYHFGVNAWGSFACLTSYSYLMLWVVAGFLILISDVPFSSENTLFECVRTTRIQSIVGRIWYILLVSVLYTLMVFLLVSIVQFASPLHPDRWDKALYTMSRGQTIDGVFLRIPSGIVAACSPFGAWAAASALLIAVLFMLGLMMFSLSLFINKRFAICITGLWAALDFAVVYMMLDPSLFYGSPMSWARLELLATAGYYTQQPSVQYCLLMLLAFSGLWITASCLFAKNQKWFDREMIGEGEQGS
jgi:uncharacterized membrane protein YtjA (UPF0391 family)